MSVGNVLRFSRNSEEGTSLVELAITLPIFILVLNGLLATCKLITQYREMRALAYEAANLTASSPDLLQGLVPAITSQPMWVESKSAGCESPGLLYEARLPEELTTAMTSATLSDIQRRFDTIQNRVTMLFTAVDGFTLDPSSCFSIAVHSQLRPSLVQTSVQSVARQANHVVRFSISTQLSTILGISMPVHITFNAPYLFQLGAPAPFEDPEGVARQDLPEGLAD